MDGAAAPRAVRRCTEWIESPDAPLPARIAAWLSAPFSLGEGLPDGRSDVHRLCANQCPRSSRAQRSPEGAQGVL